MKVACVIPARFNSSRFPGKLLALAKGKTVLQRTYESAAACPDLDAIFVATDDERIANHVIGLGGEVIWTSPTCQNGTERISEALQKDKRLQNTDLILNLQGDHPSTAPETISAVIRAMDSTASMSTAAAPIQNRQDYLSPHVVKCVFDGQGNALYFSRSPIPYIHSGKPLKAYVHIGIYCYRTSFLKQLHDKKGTPLQESEDLEQLNVLENGDRIKIALVGERAMSVDTPQDLMNLEKYLCQSNISS